MKTLLSRFGSGWALWLLLCMTGVTQAEPLRILVDVPAIGALVSEIAGDEAEVIVMPRVQADQTKALLHLSQMSLFSAADAVIWSGPATSPALEEAIDKADFGLRELRLLKLEDQRRPLTDGGEDQYQDSTSLEDQRGGSPSAPHAWLDLEVVAVWSTAIAETLGSVDAVNAALFGQRALAFASRMAELDLELKGQLEPLTGTPFWVYGVDLNGFNAAYGLMPLATIEAGGKAELSEDDIALLVSLKGTKGIAGSEVRRQRLLETIDILLNISNADGIDLHWSVDQEVLDT